MEECLTLFKQTVNNPVFLQTPVYLVFNKKDLFERQLQHTPITVCPVLQGYTGDAKNVTDCIDYVTAKFRDQVQVGGADRLRVFHIAARFKRDVKTTWDDLVLATK